MLGISTINEQLLAYQEGFCSMELGSYLTITRARVNEMWFGTDCESVQLFHTDRAWGWGVGLELALEN
jgi:hypothetical protein